MCGIVGYVGNKDASTILLNGLKRLEYRGYDSAGVATLAEQELILRRAVGKVEKLTDLLETKPAAGHIGIAHTRWATHGQPNERSAHPHIDSSGRIALVHNGIVENHAAIRTFLEEQGIVFQSETDTEALTQLIGFFYSQSGDLLESIRRSLLETSGTYGIAVICTDAPDTMIAARRGSPLIIGVGNDEFIVSSDGSAVTEHTSQVVYLNDNELVCLGPDGLRVTTTNSVPVQKEIAELELTLEQIQLGGYEHHMLKEINEQAESLRDTMRGRISQDQVYLGGLSMVEREWTRCQRVLLTGCGTAWHAGLIGEYLFEDLARMPTKVEYASELRYRNPVVEQGTLSIAISQSGETADTLAALREMRTKGATTIGLVNSVGSTIARETEAGVYLHVGPEIGVASTKAFTAQVAILALMAIDMGRRRHLSTERTAELLNELSMIPDKTTKALALDGQAQALAKRLAERDNWLYMGRGINFPVALEGALKLKEISYIHAEGLQAAEMKHGPIALIDEDMPVIVVAALDSTYEKALANIEEVRARGGQIIAIASQGDKRLEKLAEEVFYIPTTHPMLSPILSVVPLQLIAYHTACVRGHDVDKPRNLAKSVTVE